MQANQGPIQDGGPEPYISESGWGALKKMRAKSERGWFIKVWLLTKIEKWNHNYDCSMEDSDPSVN